MRRDFLWHLLRRPPLGSDRAPKRMVLPSMDWKVRRHAPSCPKATFVDPFSISRIEIDLPIDEEEWDTLDFDQQVFLIKQHMTRNWIIGYTKIRDDETIDFDERDS